MFSPRQTAGDVIALERRAQLADVLRREAGQRHRQIEPQPDPALAVVLELVELLVGLLAPLAGEDFQIFQRRRVDRAEAVGAIDAPRRVDQPLARNHRLGQIIAKALERARLDAFDVVHGRVLATRAGRLQACRRRLCTATRAATGQHRQQRRLGAADALALLARQDRLGIFGHLLGRFQVLLVQPVVLVLAVVGRVVAADQRPGVVDAAAIVALQVLARRCAPADTRCRPP